jgi:hypothetical protein
VRVGGILDQDQTMTLRQRRQAIHIRRMTGEVNRNDRPCTRGYCGFRRSRIEIVGIRLDVGKDRRCADQTHR